MSNQELYGEKIYIDTPEERERLEYRPSFKYEPNRKYTVSFDTEEVLGDAPNEDEFQATEKPPQQYESFVEHIETLEEMLQMVEGQIADMQIPVSMEQAHKLYDASPFYDSSVGHQGYIDFATYQATFDDPEEPGNAILQDIVQSYAEDVEGSIELELYEDLKELQSVLNEGYFLFKETILKRYLDAGIPSEIENNKDFVQQLQEAVIARNEQVQEITDIYKDEETNYYDSLRTEYGSSAFFQQADTFTKAKRQYDITIREEKSIQELTSLVDSLLIGVEVCARDIKSGLVLGSDIEAKEVMYLIDAQTDNESRKKELMKLSQLSLKLQLNRQIEEKKQDRDVLKNINSLSRKQRAHDELLNAYELRNNMYLKLYDTLQHLESPSKSPSVEPFLNQLAGGLQMVQEQYDSYIRGVYIIYANEFEIREKKLKKVLEKEDTRTGYSILAEYL